MSGGSTPVPPIRLVVVGAGPMGRSWIDAIAESNDAQLVGVVDLNEGAAKEAVANLPAGSIETGRDQLSIARNTEAHAIVNVTVPAAHHSVTSAALFAGYPVLTEKPVAPTVAEALSLAAASRATGRLLMVSQSRRYYAALAEYRAMLRALGQVGVLTTEFFKAPHFGGFREEMEHVLLVDMAIHTFDAARYLLNQEPVAVYCEEFNPAWSWYKGAAAASALFEMAGGARFQYTGSWCSPGLETSWNGRWRASTAQGSAIWDGASRPIAETRDDGTSDFGLGVRGEPEEIRGALAEFIDALRTGRRPSGEVHSNLLSLAMVEAAINSAESGSRIVIADVLEEAQRRAVTAESHAATRAQLLTWGRDGPWWSLLAHGEKTDPL